MNRLACAVSTLAVAVVLGISCVPAAVAGTYTLSPNPCQAFFTLGASRGTAWGSMCVGSAAILNITGQTPGDSSKYRWMKSQEVPQNVVLTGVKLGPYNYSNGRATTADPAIASTFCSPGGYAGSYWDGGCVRQDYPGDNRLFDSGKNGSAFHTLWIAPPFGGATRSTSGFMFYVNNPVDNFGSFGIDGISYAIRDDVAPTISRSAAAITANKWVSGLKTMSATAYDSEGSGVREIRGYFDGQEVTGAIVKDQSASCNWNSMSPCPASASFSHTFDTSALSEGRHALRYKAFDVADSASSANSATTAAVDVYVDNIRPDSPSALTAEADGQNGWSAVNNFGASWNNGAETIETSTQSGINKVIVDVNPTTGSQVDPAPVEVPIGGSASGISATISSVSGVVVPANGQWTLQIRLKDAAGNISNLGSADDNGATPSDVTIGVDPEAPAKPNGNNNGWVSRAQLAGGQARQTWTPPTPMAGRSPVCGWGVSASQTEVEDGPTSINVHAPTREWTFPSNLPEGSSWAHIRAIACTGVPATLTENKEVKVDLTDPSASYEGVQPGRWYKNGQSVTLRGVDALSGMAPVDTEDPDATHGAYITYTVNNVGPAPADSPRGGTTTLNITGEGEKDLVFSPVDLAGNKASPVAVRFGIDATNPTGYLENQDENTPTLIRAPIADPTSGVDHAVVQIRSTDGGSWQNLPTGLSSFSGGQVGSYAKAAIAEARFPDTKLPKGTYNVRVAAYDQAGNELVTSKTKNGSDLTVSNPMRKAANISAALFGAKRTCGRLLKKTKKGKTRKIKRKSCTRRVRGKVVFIGGSSKRTVGWQRGVIVQGFLTGSNYAPLAGKHVDFYTTATGKGEILAGSTVTKSDGSYAFRIGKGVSRKIRIVYEGSELIQNVSTDGTLGTRASVSLRLSKKRVRSGGKVKFTGTVKTYDKVYPEKGKIVVLQFKQGKKWRPAIALSRTNQKGRFSMTYRFGRIPKSVRARIQFRVYVPTEINFAHENSASKSKIARVN